MGEVEPKAQMRVSEGLELGPFAARVLEGLTNVRYLWTTILTLTTVLAGMALQMNDSNKKNKEENSDKDRWHEMERSYLAENSQRLYEMISTLQVEGSRADARISDLQIEVDNLRKLATENGIPIPPFLEALHAEYSSSAKAEKGGEK